METQTPPVMVAIAIVFSVFVAITLLRFLFVVLPRACRSHNPAFWMPSSTSRPNGFDEKFCKILYDLGKLCGIDGSQTYVDSERKLENDLTPINGSFPGYHAISLKNGVKILYGIDYYDGSKKIFRKRVTYKDEPVPESTANELLQREYDFFKSLYEKERAKRDAEIASLANWKGEANA